MRYCVLALLLAWTLRAPTIITVCNAGSPTCTTSNLQTAIDSAVSGDIISVQAGETFQAPPGGPFNLDNDLGSDYVTIQSSALASLPLDTRVSPTQIALMAKLCTTSNASEVIKTEVGAHHWKLVGLEITLCATGQKNQNDLIWLGGSPTEPNVDQVTHHIVIDRCYIHGYPYDQGPKRGIRPEANDIIITNNYIDEIHFSQGNSESHGIGLGAAGINITVLNNTISSVTEGSFTGGGRDFVSQRFPHNVYFAGNHTVKRGSWATVNYNFDPEGAGPPPAFASSFNAQTWTDTGDRTLLYIRSGIAWRQIDLPLGANEPICFPGMLWRNQAAATIWECNAAGTRWISGAADVMMPDFATGVSSVVTGATTTAFTTPSAVESLVWGRVGELNPISCLITGGTGAWAALNGNKYRCIKTGDASGRIINVTVNTSGFGTGFSTITLTPQFVMWPQKNGAEFKTGVGLRYEGNIIENSWPMTIGQQRGFGFLFNWVPVQDGPNAPLQDVYFANNILRNSPNGFASGSVQRDEVYGSSSITIGETTYLAVSGFFGRIGEQYYVSGGTGDFADLGPSTGVYVTDTGASQGGTIPSNVGGVKFNYDSRGKDKTGVSLRFRDDSHNKKRGWAGDLTISNNLVEIASPMTFVGGGGFGATYADTGTHGYTATYGVAFQTQFTSTISNNTIIRRHVGPNSTFFSNSVVESSRFEIHKSSAPSDVVVPTDIRFIDNLDDSSAGRFFASGNPPGGGGGGGLGGTCNNTVNLFWTPSNGLVTMKGNVAAYGGVYSTAINVLNILGYGGSGPCRDGWTRVFGRNDPSMPIQDADGNVTVTGGPGSPVGTFSFASGARLIEGSKFCVTASNPSSMIGCYTVPNGVDQGTNLWSAVPLPGVPNGAYTGVVMSSALNMVDFPNRNYRLASNSVVKGIGQDGADPGADLNVVEWATATAESGLPNPYLQTHIYTIEPGTTSVVICFNAYDTTTATMTIATSRTYTPDLGSDSLTSQTGRRQCITTTGLTANTRYFARMNTTGGRYRDTLWSGRFAEFYTKP